MIDGYKRSAMVVLVAFAGCGGGDDGKPAATPTATPPVGEITFAQGRATPLTLTRAQVTQQLGPPQPSHKGFPDRVAGLPCIYYGLSDQPGSYRFCFAKDGLVANAATVFPKQ